MEKSGAVITPNFPQFEEGKDKDAEGDRRTPCRRAAAGLCR